MRNHLGKLRDPILDPSMLGIQDVETAFLRTQSSLQLPRGLSLSSGWGGFFLWMSGIWKKNNMHISMYISIYTYICIYIYSRMHINYISSTPSFYAHSWSLFKSLPKGHIYPASMSLEPHKVPATKQINRHPFNGIDMSISTQSTVVTHSFPIFKKVMSPSVFFM